MELKLYLAEAPPEFDQTQVQNILKRHCRLAKITAGEPFSEIAEAEGVSKPRVKDVIILASLTPDILDTIGSGEKPRRSRR